MMKRNGFVAAAVTTLALLAAQPAHAGDCATDVNGDGTVDILDLLAVLADWGPCPGCPADVDGNGEVDVLDLLAVLADWGAECGGTIALELAGNDLSVFPHFEFVRAFNEGEAVSFAIDPHLYPQVIGQACFVYVVEPKTAVDWDADPTLVDVRGTPDLVMMDGPDIQDNTFLVSVALDGDGGTDLGVGYDMVIDLGMDGVLGAGDFIDGYGDEPGFFVVKDPVTAGPLTTASMTYSGGTWLGQVTVYPADIASMGELPLVVISHGNGHQYTWYTYLQNHLASYGYIVMSHQNNTVPGIETASTTTLTNTDYIIGNQATIGGGVLDGHIDSSRITWIGHSRGGEGVARAYDRISDGAYTPTYFTLDDIVLVSSIAPTDFLGTSSANPHGVNYHFIYGASDGDVSGIPSNDIAQAFHLYERATGFRASTYVQGAGHNDFNCCGFADATGPDLIGRPEAQRVAKAAYLAVIKHFVDGSIPAKDYLWRQYENLRPPSVASTTTVDNEYKDGPGGGNFVIDDFQIQSSTSVSSSGGTVTFDVTSLVEGRLDDGDSSFTWLASDPMNGMTRARVTDSTKGIVFDYVSDSFLEFEVIAGERDLTDDVYLSFRSCQGTRHPNTRAELADLTFTVTLRDGTGTTSAIDIGAYRGGVEEPYQRTGFGIFAGWQNEFETVRIRLTDFLSNGSGLDLADIEAVRFEFGPSFGSTEGRLGLDDVEITSD